MNTLILTTSYNLNSDQVHPYLNSLIQSGFTGTLGLISNDVRFPKESIGELPFSIIYWPYTYYGYPDLHGGVNRLFLYRDFLDRHNNYDQVITTGIRDVIFQSNPDWIKVKRCSLYQEDRSRTIKDCPYNRKWIRDIYPEQYDSIKDAYMICPEVIISPVDQFRQLTNNMLIEVEKLKDRDYLCDMAILMGMYYRGDLDFCEVIQNDFGDVYTVGYVDFLTVSKHKIINSEGNIPTIVHQYDRHVKHV